MGDFLRDSGMNRTLFLVCCIIWISSPTGGNTVSWLSGSTGTLPCTNQSLSTLQQLTWKMDGVNLFTFKPQKPIYTFPLATRLNIRMSLNASQLYALIITGAQESHSGNYTCSTLTSSGVREQKWELLITDRAATEPSHMLMIVVGTIAVFVSCIFVISWITIRRCKVPAGSDIQPSSTDRVQQDHTEDIYENALGHIEFNQSFKV